MEGGLATLQQGESKRATDHFVLELEDKATETARTVLLATGTEYRLPDLPGLAERWGRDVFHCPFCHGWEHRDGKLGVLGVTGIHRVPLIKLWTDDVTLLTDGAALGLAGCATGGTAT